MVNGYRADNGLPAIPQSKSLSLVSSRHVRDLDENIGTLTHGWSDCAYEASDSKTWSCMWKAPQRWTKYPGNGYEDAHGGTGGYVATAQTSLDGWKKSPAHNAVVLETGPWKGMAWQALGVGLHRGFAVLWFGKEPDT